MYEQWYTKQSDLYNDSFSSDWETFGLRIPTSDGSLGLVERLNTTDLLDWISGQGNVLPLGLEKIK